MGMITGTRIGLLKVTMAIISLGLISALHVGACSFGGGYFYQITALKGRVVGTQELHIFDSPRWLRQTFVRRHARLTLYEYRQPFDRRLLVKAVETDDQGSFDFGQLRIGHYTLRIDDDNSFDVEIKDLPQKTESVLIDASPVYPDCSGGHEFHRKDEKMK